VTVIDHFSIAVSNLEESKSFYRKVLAILDFKILADFPNTAGFGKKHPEFWLNHRPNRKADSEDNGCHICLRARSKEQVEEFYQKALASGGRCYGPPGIRKQYANNYYACFIQDRDGYVIELVTFIEN